MCGISGYFSSKNLFSKNKLLKISNDMNNSLIHRGPDSGGVWIEHNTSCFLAHRRLSIIDLTKNGSQPMISKSKRFILCYNGEIYNCKELQKLLQNKLNGHSDTEIILELFAQYGLENVIEKIHGMFAFSLYDRKKKQLFLCRDRLGKKPLFWSKIGNSFIFSSELKSLMRFPNFQKIVNRNAISNFLRHGYIPSPNTIFENTFKLGPGKILKIDLKTFSPKIKNYWSLEKVIKNRAFFQNDDRELIKKLDNLLTDSVSQRMIADVPLGSFLSGGIDSSIVTALMQKVSKEKVNTFSIGFNESSYNEANFAKKIANHLGTNHTEVYISSKEAQDVVPLIPKYYDEPFGDSSQIPTFLISSIARKSVKVALSGDGGDELFHGYNRYEMADKMIWIFKLPTFFKIIIYSAVKLFTPNQWNKLNNIFSNSIIPPQIGDKLYKLIKIIFNDYNNFYLNLISAWDNPNNLVINGHETKGLVWENNLDQVVTEFSEKIRALDTLTYLPDDILTKVDRASMANSLEVRSPILDNRVVEFSWNLKKTMMSRHNKSKWILRQVLKNYVPEKFFDRPKMGFGVPISVWLRNDLKSWSQDLLSDQTFSKHGLLNKEPIQKRFNEHQNMKNDWHFSLWNILMLHAWADEYL